MESEKKYIFHVYPDYPGLSLETILNALKSLGKLFVLTVGACCQLASENHSEQHFPSFGKPTPYLGLRLRVCLNTLFQT